MTPLIVQHLYSVLFLFFPRGTDRTRLYFVYINLFVSTGFQNCQYSSQNGRKWTLHSTAGGAESEQARVWTSYTKETCIKLNSWLQIGKPNEAT